MYHIYVIYAYQFMTEGIVTHARMHACMHAHTHTHTHTHTHAWTSKSKAFGSHAEHGSCRQCE